MLFESFYTIHVTPEEQCSYVSFETNVRMSNYEALVKNVLEVFRPKRFTMTMVADEGALRQMRGAPDQCAVLRRAGEASEYEGSRDEGASE